MYQTLIAKFFVCLVSFWCLYCLLWTSFIPCSEVSIVNFEQVNADWVVELMIRLPHFITQSIGWWYMMSWHGVWWWILAGIYMFKVNKRNTRTSSFNSQVNSSTSKTKFQYNGNREFHCKARNLWKMKNKIVYRGRQISKPNKYSAGSFRW